MSTRKVIYYETGCQQQLPLFSYEGMTFAEAEEIVIQKTPFRHFELVTPDVIQKKCQDLRDYRQSQWYISPYKELITGDRL